MHEIYRIAFNELGVKEVPGQDDNPRIIEYHATTLLRATDDEVPWCSAFVNWCVTQAGYIGTNSAAAKSWLGWGKKLEEPVKGCICVLSRIGGNHVGLFHDKDDAGFIYILGGNQGDRVSISRFPISRLIEYRTRE
jgi:uncharacterized protein (TIGR02594 family)